MNPDVCENPDAQGSGEFPQHVGQLCLQDGMRQLAHIPFQYFSVDVVPIRAVERRSEVLLHGHQDTRIHRPQRSLSHDQVQPFAATREIEAFPRNGPRGHRQWRHQYRVTRGGVKCLVLGNEQQSGQDTISVSARLLERAA